jgi:hypothetical protein
LLNRDNLNTSLTITEKALLFYPDFTCTSNETYFRYKFLSTRNLSKAIGFLKFPIFAIHTSDMTAIQLKTLLIHRISEINDVSFLKALKTILDSKSETGVIQLTQEQLDDIIASKKEIEQGLFIENNAFEKEVKQWLNAR